MSDSQPTPKKVVPKPIKASERPAQGATPSAQLPAKDRKDSRDKRKKRQGQPEELPKGNPALMRGPRPVKPATEPEPVLSADEDSTEEATEATADAEASAEAPESSEVSE